LLIASERSIGAHNVTPHVAQNTTNRRSAIDGRTTRKVLLSDDHFSVDDTLIEAWASMKSFRPKDGSGEPPAPGRNGERDFQIAGPLRACDLGSLSRRAFRQRSRHRVAIERGSAAWAEGGPDAGAREFGPGGSGRAVEKP
jgi:hypothetical protein